MRWAGRKFSGRLTQIGGATGSMLSLFPPENATGNYVKVVQRIPVRIDFTNLKQENGDYALRPGFSVTPEGRCQAQQRRTRRHPELRSTSGERRCRTVAAVRPGVLLREPNSGLTIGLPSRKPRRWNSNLTQRQKVRSETRGLPPGISSLRRGESWQPPQSARRSRT